MKSPLLEEVLRDEIRNICTYWSEPDEISGVESAGTAGYCLSEEQFEKLFNLFNSFHKSLLTKDIEMMEGMKMSFDKKETGGDGTHENSFRIGFNRALSHLKAIKEKDLDLLTEDKDK